MQKYAEIWASFTEEQKKHFIKQVAGGWRWKQYSSFYSEYFADWEALRDFGSWLRKENPEFFNSGIEFSQFRN